MATAPSWFKVEPEVLHSCTLLSIVFEFPPFPSQAIKGAPGEIVPLTISAVDQSNNWQEAIWSVNEDGEVCELSSSLNSDLDGV